MARTAVPASPGKVPDMRDVPARWRSGSARRAWWDTANRSFSVLVAIALVPYVLLGAFGCGLLSIAAHRVAEHGWSGLTESGDLRPGVVFFTVVTGGTIAAVVSVRRQVRATRALARSLGRRAVTLPAAVEEAADRGRLAGRVDVVDDADRFSFTYGLVATRVVLSRGLVDALGPTELDAVLAHERYHVRNRDTLKAVVAEAASAAFFFLPALGDLQARYLAGRELAADHHATAQVGGSRPLVRALSQVLDQPQPAGFGAAAAMGGPDFLELRVAQLETGREPPLARVPRWSSAVTTVALGALSAAFLLTVARTGAAMPMMDGAGSPGSPGGTLVAATGAVACSTAWAWVGLLVLRGAARSGSR